MDEIGIYVFSGTGNTLKCARALKDALGECNVAANLHRIEDGTEQVSEKDLILCYPVYGFNPPACMLTFCRNLPRRNGDIWFLKTSGEPLRLNEDSSMEMAGILRKKGYGIKGEFHYVMPYNIMFRHSDELASLMWKTARARIPDAARFIAEGKQSDIRSYMPAKALSRICRIEHWFYPKNGRLFRVDTDRCLRCMKCVNTCPTKNICYDGKDFTFAGSCIGCMRCSFGCPANAIHIGILDLIRVNGPYDLDRDPDQAVIGRYCKKSYERYFSGEYQT